MPCGFLLSWVIKEDQLLNLTTDWCPAVNPSLIVPLSFLLFLVTCLTILMLCNFSLRALKEISTLLNRSQCFKEQQDLAFVGLFSLNAVQYLLFITRTVVRQKINESLKPFFKQKLQSFFVSSFPM